MILDYFKKLFTGNKEAPVRNNREILIAIINTIIRNLEERADEFTCIQIEHLMKRDSYFKDYQAEGVTEYYWRTCFDPNDQEEDLLNIPDSAEEYKARLAALEQLKLRVNQGKVDHLIGE